MRQDRTLVRELQDSHRTSVLTLCAMLLLSLASSGYLLLVSQPAVTRYTDLVRDARLMHEAMLDQETGLRGWLATGDADFLEPTRKGREEEVAAAQQMLERSSFDRRATADLLPALDAQQEWDRWADRAAQWRVTPRERGNGELARFLVRGKALFDDYRAAEARSTAYVVAQRDRAIAGQRAALVITLVATLLMLTAGGVHTALRRRRLERDLAQPMRQLLQTLHLLRSGDRATRTRLTGVQELDAIGSALDGFTRELVEAEELATAREVRLALLARRLETVITVARETSGSLSVGHVGESVTEAAAELLGAPTTLWARDDEGVLCAVTSSADPGGLPSADHEPPALVGAVAADARPAGDGAARAYPLILAGAVVGVLEVGAATAPDDDVERVLAALLSTAAAGLESARLHRTAREQAEVDALTRLPNRRRLEEDLAAAWQQSRDDSRPCSFVMVDLDHFKSLNDTHGHPVGDMVLRSAASAVAANLREHDTAYRYGGEEFAVLLRETDLEAALDVAERLRTAVAAVKVPGRPVRVTASLGVATVEQGMSDPAALVAAADRALYRAKRGGRDRVEVGGGLSTTLEPAW